MLIWRSGGGGPRLVGCGTVLLAGVVITLVVYALSGGHCVFVLAP